MRRRTDMTTTACPEGVVAAQSAMVARMADTARQAQQAMAAYRNGLQLLNADQIYLFSTVVGALDNMLRAFDDPEEG